MLSLPDWAAAVQAVTGLVRLLQRLRRWLRREEGGVGISQPTRPRVMTVSEAGQALGAQGWWISKLYDRGLLPEPPRLGGMRVIYEEDLPAIRAALVAAGYLKR